MSHGVELVVVLAAAGLAGVAAAAAAWLLASRRALAGAEARVTAVVEQLTGRVDELARDLQTALARAESEGRRGQLVGDLTASLDLDEILERVIAAARGLSPVDAVVVSIDEGSDAGDRIVAADGMELEQAERQTFAGPGVEAEAIVVAYRYPSTESQLRAALVVPLVTESGPAGFLAVYTRNANADLEEAVGDELAEIAARTGPAVGNALRYREARRLADLDALTGLHNRRFFHETLQRECARAKRYSRRLSLVLLDLDDFKAINERIGHLAGDAVLAEAAARIRSVVRTADVACRVGGDEFAVLLPESGIGQAEQLYRRIETAVSSRPIGHVARLSVSAGIAELQEHDEANTLFERADAALYQAKDEGKARVYPAVVRDEPRENSA